MTSQTRNPFDLTDLFKGIAVSDNPSLRELAFILSALADIQDNQYGPPIEEKSPGERFIISTDGSALGNPGPGGWAYLIRFPCGNVEPNSGGLEYTTNNIAELVAATKALNTLPVDAAGVLRTDSTYVVNGVNKWRKGWEKRGWINSQGKPVANVQEWQALFRAVDARPGMKLEWVRGHNGNADNETVDRLAKAEAERIDQLQYLARGLRSA